MHVNICYFSTLEQSGNLTLNGDTDIVVTHTTTFSCLSKGGNPKALFEWHICNHEGCRTLEENVHLTDEGESILEYTAIKEDNDHETVCIVTQLEGSDRRKTSLLLNIMCKYSV